MGYETLKLTVEGGVATVTLNRPRVLNAINRAMTRELAALITVLESDAAVRVVCITGAGDRAFAAGADIAEFRELGPVEALDLSREMQETFQQIANLPKPVVAAVNGLALGGGCELAMACDVIVAAETARFGQPEVNLGIIPGAGGTQRLGRLIGRNRAKALIFTGELISADEAFRMGLVNQVVPAADLLATTNGLACRMMEKGAVALSMAKRAIDQGMDLPIDQGLETEAHAFALCFATEDKTEGVRAFLEKRQPRFTGR